MKNSTLVPIYKHGLHHVRYDTADLHELLRSVKLENLDRDNFLGDKRAQWRKYFVGRPVVQSNEEDKRFDYSMKKDSVAASFIMLRRKVDERHPHSRQLLTNGDIIVGIDPGYRLMLAGVRHRFTTDSATTLSWENNVDKIKV